VRLALLWSVACRRPPLRCQQPAIHSADAQVSGLLSGRRLRVVIEQPADLAGTEIRIENQPGAMGPVVGIGSALPGAAQIAGAAVLPDQGWAHRNAIAAAPEHRGFPLIGDATGANSTALRITELALQRLQGLQLALPDVQRLLLHPAIGRVVNGQGHLGGCLRFTLRVEQYGAGTAGALVEGQQQRF